MAKTPPVEETTTAVAVQETAPPPMTIDAFATGEGDSGFEETTAEDYMIPRLKVLQAVSPQCKEGKPEFDEKFRPGMLYNNVTEESISGKAGVYFIPCVYRRVGTLWDPEEQNRSAAFRGSVSAGEVDAILERAEFVEKTGNLVRSGEHDGLVISDTREWWGLVSETPDFKTFNPILFSLASSQLKKSKKWLQLAQALRVQGKPVKLWSQVYHITTAPEVAGGNDIVGTFIKHVGNVPSMEVFNEAALFREMVRGGAAKAVMDDGAAPMSEGDAPF